MRHFIKNFRTFIFLIGFGIGMTLLSTSSRAESENEGESESGSGNIPIPNPFDLNWHGFLSQGYFKSTANNWLGDSQEGSFDFTEVGLNFTKSLNRNIDIGAQLFARKLGPGENFIAHFDWFYANYQVGNWFRFKVGRIKIPYGLYNEQSDIDAARVPILLPQSIYPIQSRDFLLAQNGVQVYGFGDVGEMGSLGYHLYAGSINVNQPELSNSEEVINQINVRYLFGGRLLWETPLEGLRAAFTLQTVKVDVDLSLAGMPASGVLPVTQYIGSLEYSFKRWLFAAEYSRRYTSVENSMGPLPVRNANGEGYYGMMNYQITDSFAPGVYYSMNTPDILNRGDREKMQGDFAFYFRYDFNQNWLLKLEGHLMNGTADLNPALNGNQSQSSLKDAWQMFLVKTTVYF